MMKLIFHTQGGTVMKESIYEVKNVLVVDDAGSLKDVDESVRKVLPNFRIYRTSSPAEAVEWLRCRAYQLVFISLTDSHECEDLINTAQYNDRPIPVIVSSALNEITRAFKSHVYQLPETSDEYVPFFERIFGFEYGWLPLRTLNLATALFGNMNIASIHYVKPMVSFVSRWKGLKIRNAYRAV
jgi:hypothetical protein